MMSSVKQRAKTLIVLQQLKIIENENIYLLNSLALCVCVSVFCKCAKMGIN